jgi:hypothetical protein
MTRVASFPAHVDIVYGITVKNKKSFGFDAVFILQTVTFIEKKSLDKILTQMLAIDSSAHRETGTQASCPQQIFTTIPFRPGSNISFF